MKKILIYVALAIEILNAATLDEIKKSGTIKIATEGTYKPYSYHDENDKLVGYDVEIASEVAKKLGVKAKFIEAPWDALIAGFDAQKSDIMFNQVSIREDRKTKYDFSIPYTASYGAIIVRKNNNNIKTLNDVKNKVAAASATSNWNKILTELGANIQTVSGFNQAVELVISNRVELLMNDDVTFYDFIKNKPNAPLKIAVKTNEPVLSAAIVKKGNTELINAVNQALSELFKEGKIQQISQKYFGKDISK